MSGDRPDRREVRWRVWQQLPLLVLLVAVWMLLWGELSLLSLLTGLAVALLVQTVFYLPPGELPGRLNVLRFAQFVAVAAAEIAAGSVAVAARAFGPHRDNAVIAVPLRTSSDFILTVTAIVVSLVPGSLILEIDRSKAILYVHLLATDTPAAIEKARRGVLDTERRIVLAMGSRVDQERIRA